MTTAPPTLKHLYESVLRRYPDRPAVQFEGDTLTYGQLDTRSASLANALLARGRTPGDRVGILLSNRPAYAVADVALARAGLARVPLNDMLADDDCEYMLRNADVSVAIVGPNFVDVVEGIAPNVPTLEEIVTVDVPDDEQPSATLRPTRMAALEAEYEPSVPDVEVTQDTLAGIFHTGGTTGDPKGVEHTQETLSLNALAHAVELDIDADDTLLLSTPLPHSAGLVMAGGLARGSTHVITQGFDPEETLERIESQRISWTFMVPTMIYRVLDVLDEQEYDTSALETLVYGAAPMKPDRLREGLDELGDVFVQLYGQYETPDLITVLPKDEHDPANETRLSSCGAPTTLCQVKIVDDEGTETGRGEPGEIVARGAYSMEGYYDQPEQTAETMTDGWIHTGDIGRMDEDGYVYILDRDSDVIISGGMNVYSVTVEDVVQQHEQVANVAVIGVPDDEWGEAVRAIVVPDGEDVDIPSLRAFCDERLADYEKPKSYDVVEDLPTTPYGKLDKKALREPYWQEQPREVS